MCGCVVIEGVVQVENTFTVNEQLGKGAALRVMGREVDALVAPLQQRKHAALAAQFAQLQEQVRRRLSSLYLDPCW
jgi:hypothetical protein